MATRKKIVYEVGAEVQNAVAGFQRAAGAVGGWLQAIRNGIANAGIAQFNAQLARMGQALESTIRRGIEFNSLLEDARLGIAAALRQFNPEQFRDFNAALTEAGNALGLLQKRAIESPATLKELVGAFQSISGAALSAGMTVRQTVDLTVLMSQALAGMGVRSEQIIQESRALITGNITEDAFAAKQLGITREQITAAREQGRVFEFLSQRMAAFGEAGQRASGTFTVLKSTLEDLFDKVSGELTEPTFEQLKLTLEELNKVISRPSFAGDLKTIAEGMAALFKALGSAAVFTSEWLAPAMRAAKLAWLELTTDIQVGWIETVGFIKEHLLETWKFLNKIPFAPKIDTQALESDLLQRRLKVKSLQDVLAAAVANSEKDEPPLPMPQNDKGGTAEPERKPTLGVVAKETVELLSQINDAHRQATSTRQQILDDEYARNVARVQQEVRDHEEKEIALLQLAATYSRQRDEIVRGELEQEVTAVRELAAHRESVFQQSQEEINRMWEAGMITQREAIARTNEAVLEYEASLIALKQALLEYAALHPELTGAAEEIARIEETLARLKNAVQDTGFIATLRRGMREFADEWGAIGRNVASTLTNGIGRAVDGVSSSIMGMIDGTQTWGQAFANVARGIIADLIRVVVQWVAQMTIVRGLRHVMDAQQTASAAKRAAAEAPAATMASIGSWGAAAAVGVAALLAGLAVGIAAFASGGLVRGAGGPRDDRNLVAVSDGEYIVNAAAVDRYGLNYLDAINSQALGASSTAAGMGGGGNVTVSPAPVNFAVINNKAQLREFLRSNDGRQVLLDEMTAQKIELGLES